MTKPTLTKVLVANRGEIAVRVLHGAARLGYGTVAVYSDADAGARHVRCADVAVRIGPAAAADSYMNIAMIVDAACASGADAVHPGYGFLAENADFARAVEAAGLVFIGPTPGAIELMGNKRAAKARMATAGVPCIPGYQGERGTDESPETVAAKATEMGLPVMIKAAAGGGGRGMRAVDDEQTLVAAIASARAEAQSAFGSGELILEKAITGARHVEIQILADSHGNVIHLGERDCSIQRRHQKIIEEAPCPVVGPALRAAMGAAAVKAAQAIDYRGVGTVEFLLDPRTDSFLFLEMNTRLQVEHPVTELITGIDLVEWQLRVAAGEALGFSQDDVLLTGHAIEARLCAEDPADDFLPHTGSVLAWREPTGAGIRVDHGVLADGEVSPFYDSMQAKLIAYGRDRETARRRLRQALDDCVFFGVVSNKDFLRAILAHPAFVSGDFDTGYIPEHYPDPAAALPAADSRHHALAAALFFHDNACALGAAAGVPDELLTWHSANATPTPIVLRTGRHDELIRRNVQADALGHYRVAAEAAEAAGEHVIDIIPEADYRLRFVLDGNSGRARFVHTNDALWLDAFGVTAGYQDATLAAAETRAEPAGSGEITAASAGKIIEIKVGIGDSVEQGQTLLVLEAMKIEFQLVSDLDGTVTKILAATGEQVAARQVLLRVEPTLDL